MIGWTPEPPWIFSGVPSNPKQERYWSTSAVGVGPEVAVQVGRAAEVDAHARYLPGSCNWATSDGWRC